MKCLVVLEKKSNDTCRDKAVPNVKAAALLGCALLVASYGDETRVWRHISAIIH